MGFVSGVAAVGLMGAGMYMLLSENTKRQMARTMESAKNDADRLMNAKIKTMNKMANN